MRRSITERELARTCEALVSEGCRHRAFSEVGAFFQHASVRQNVCGWVFSSHAVMPLSLDDDDDNEDAGGRDDAAHFPFVSLLVVCCLAPVAATTVRFELN